jgi:hypothetical protein
MSCQFAFCFENLVKQATLSGKFGHQFQDSKPFMIELYKVQTNYKNNTQHF